MFRKMWVLRSAFACRRASWGIWGPSKGFNHWRNARWVCVIWQWYWYIRNADQCTKKGWEDILRKQSIEKVNADPDEIDISSDDSDLEDNDHIEAIEKENPQISFAAALQMLDQLQDFAFSFADVEKQC